MWPWLGRVHTVVGEVSRNQMMLQNGWLAKKITFGKGADLRSRGC